MKKDQVGIPGSKESLANGNSLGRQACCALRVVLKAIEKAIQRFDDSDQIVIFSGRCPKQFCIFTENCLSNAFDSIGPQFESIRRLEQALKNVDGHLGYECAALIKSNFGVVYEGCRAEEYRNHAHLHSEWAKP